MATSVPVAPNRGDAPGREPSRSTLYKVVMTPVIFVSFLISLLLVDLRYSVRRSQYHPEEYSSRLPRWLHHIIYRYQPYQYVHVDKYGRETPERAYNSFYHSKQRKLMKMEVDDAFQIRGSVLFVMGILAMVAVWGLWRLAAWAFRSVKQQ